MDLALWRELFDITDSIRQVFKLTINKWIRITMGGEGKRERHRGGGGKGGHSERYIVERAYYAYSVNIFQMTK